MPTSDRQPDCPPLNPLPTNQNHTPPMKDTRASLLRSITMLTGSLLACGWLSSCRTTEGFGQDLQKVGSKIENEAYKRG